MIRRIVPFVIACAIMHAPSVCAQSAAEPLLGALPPGPHPVGYRLLPLRDPSRPTGPPGRPDRDRSLSLHVWYPASEAAGTPMRLGDYAGRGASAGQTEAAAVAAHRTILGRLFPPALSDAEWSAYLSAVMTARRDAAPAAGRYPLLVGSFRPMSMTLAGEYLASHGYVVAFVQSPWPENILADGAVLEALVLTQVIRDLEIAIASLRELPYVDPIRLGTFGFSGSGLSALPLAMRHPDVLAVAQLDTGYFGPQGSSYRELPAYDPAVLRTPYFYAYGASTLAQSDLHQAELKRMRYAPRVVLFAGEPRLHHWDFATEGPALLATSNRRRAERHAALRVTESAYRNLRRFFDAYVRGDADARTAIARTVTEPGPGALIDVQFMAPLQPAISRTEFRRLLDENAERAVAAAREGLARDPQGALFDEGYLNGLGYELLNARQGEKAIAVFRLNVEAHPGSVNAIDSLSEGYESTGQRAAALEWTQKALAALPADKALAGSQRKVVEDGLQARLARLKG